MTSPRPGIYATLLATVGTALSINCTRAEDIPSYLTPTPAPMGIGNSCGENAMESSISEVLGRANHLLGEEKVKVGLALPLNIETRIGMIHALTIGTKRQAAPESGEAKALADLAERLHSVQTTLAMEESYCEAQRAAEYEREHPAGVVYSAKAEEMKEATIRQQTGQPVTVNTPTGLVIAMTNEHWGATRDSRR